MTIGQSLLSKILNEIVMKKFTLILALIGMISLQSCVTEEVVTPNPIDNDTIAEVFEYSNVDFHSGNNFSVFLDFPHPIYASDMVLVYHLYEVNNGNDVWRLMPQTYYLNGGGELDYNFDFTRFDATVFLDANFNLNTLDPSWSQNQVFRVVVIPAFFANKNALDINNFEAVINHYKIKEAQFKKVTLK